MELFADTTPLTAENFRCLCTGEKGVGRHSKRPLHFKGTIFHRVIPGFMMQGGDFQNRNGTGGESIYGKEFRDENFIRKHLGPGMLSMANAGAHTNGSQFFLTFASAPHLNGKHVVFGRVVSGLEVVKQVEQVRTGREDRPTQEVVIVDCGEIKAADESTASAPVKAKATTKRVDDASDDEDAHELPASSAAAAAAGSSVAAAAASQYPVSKGNASLDLIHSTLADAAKEESQLKQQLAAAEAKAKAAGKELSARERKMIELKLKMNAGRKANAQGVAEESKKHELKSQGVDVDGTGSNKQLSNKEFKARQAQWNADQEAQGQDPALAYLHETAESAEYRGANAKGKAAAKKASFGWDVFNTDAQYNAYNKRLNYLPATAAAAEAEDTDDAAAALSYGRSSKPSAAGIDRMVAELADGQARKEKFSRRRPFNEDEDVSYINERNRVFNKKANRAYEKYTLEIKQNIERGTAL